jgi:hypothetical protein
MHHVLMPLLWIAMIASASVGRGEDQPAVALPEGVKAV